MIAAMKIAALYVAANGAYRGLEDVEPWGEDRDARLYDGPWPVVAHPPCARWGRLAALVESRHPHMKRGEDDGCFAAALDAVRKWGGVLEHPAFSDAFTAFGLPIPDSRGGWQRGICGGWSCYVEQGRYGHPAKKATWLYVFRVESPPAMRWGRILDNESEARFALVTDGGTKGERGKRGAWGRRYSHLSSFERDGDQPELSVKARSATPEPFRDVLIGLARRTP